jgi:hypothetical protein
LTNEVTDSRSVDWWAVYQFTLPFLQEVEGWPLVGSLPWQRLPDHDPAKLAAVLDAGRDWALRAEVAQAALAQASHDISASADWSGIARSIRRRHPIYIRRTA